MIWLRFFHHDTGALNRIDDIIDETHGASFWITLIACPSLPFMQLASNTEMSGLKKFLVRGIAGSKVARDVTNVILLFKRESVIKPIIIAELLGCVIAVLSYYLGWWLLPNFLSDVLFFQALFFIEPLAAIFGFIGGIMQVFRGADAEDKPVVKSVETLLKVSVKRTRLESKDGEERAAEVRGRATSLPKPQARQRTASPGVVSRN
jgi:hypothetical protein